MAALVAAAQAAPAKLLLHDCLVQGVHARCGTLSVPENRAHPLGRQIGLRVVVIPSLEKPARPDALTFLAGGPGVAATDVATGALTIWIGVHEQHDIVLVDQRGTGASRPLECREPKKAIATPAALRANVASCQRELGADWTQYGTRMAADDLEAVRVALGYPSFDVYGTSYGATLAQVDHSTRLRPRLSRRLAVCSRTCRLQAIAAARVRRPTILGQRRRASLRTSTDDPPGPQLRTVAPRTRSRSAP